MENDKNFIGNEKLEFRQIVLGHIKNILNLSLRSNSDGRNLSLYKNAIEGLSDVLIPFYDKQMNSEIEEFEKELIVINKENYKREKSLCPHDYSETYGKIHYAKMKGLYRNLFRKLNLLLKRNDYLKESVYGESNSEEIVEEKGEGDE